jgi:ketosteroid isomerase-like protein
MRDLIPPAVARSPVEAIEIVSLAISDGDLEAALAQYEDGAVLRPWQRRPADDADLGQDHAQAGQDPAEAGNAPGGLQDVMELRLPLAVRVIAVVPAAGQTLVLAERRISGAGPDGERVELTGSGAAIVRRQPGGGWRIAADAWCLAGTGGPGTEPDGFPRDSP